MVNVIQVETDERVQAMLHFRDIGNGDLKLTMVTKNGTTKRLDVSLLKNIRQNGLRAINLDEGDELVSVIETDGHSHILIATTTHGLLLDENDVRSMGPRRPVCAVYASRG